jgi:hypothetical protein
MPAQAFAALIFVRWAGTGHFSFLGQNQLMFFFDLVFYFPFSGKIGKLVNDSKLSMIKKFSCGEILDKNIFMSVVFSCNFRNFVFNFLVKFDPTIGFNWKIESN